MLISEIISSLLTYTCANHILWFYSYTLGVKPCCDVISGIVTVTDIGRIKSGSSSQCKESMLKLRYSISHINLMLLPF